MFHFEQITEIRLLVVQAFKQREFAESWWRKPGAKSTCEPGWLNIVYA